MILLDILKYLQCNIILVLIINPKITMLMLAFPHFLERFGKTSLCLLALVLLLFLEMKFLIYNNLIIIMLIVQVAKKIRELMADGRNCGCSP